MNGNEVAELRQLLVEFKASMDQRFDAMDRRFDRLEKKVDDLTDVVQGMSKGFSSRFDALEQKVGRGQSVMTSSFPGPRT
jgi:bisphosphoglycerate-independent phosphoglycerate mutase (AlkP superfamily)